MKKIRISGGLSRRDVSWLDSNIDYTSPISEHGYIPKVVEVPTRYIDRVFNRLDNVIEASEAEYQSACSALWNTAKPSQKLKARIKYICHPSAGHKGELLAKKATKGRLYTLRKVSVSARYLKGKGDNFKMGTVPSRMLVEHDVFLKMNDVNNFSLQ